MNFSEWNQWNDLTDDPDQKKRLKSAQQAECTPIRIDTECHRGEFSGNHGTYETTLVHCTCIDFSRRKKPCKHMYRLAIEFAIIQADVKSDLSKVKVPSPPSLSLAECIARLESLGISDQKAFKNFLYEYQYHKKEYIALQKDIAHRLIKAKVLLPVQDDLALLNFYNRNALLGLLDKAEIFPPKRNMSLDELTAWCLENVPDVPALCGDIEVLGLFPEMKKRVRKVYTYLLRKYDSEPYFDPSSGMKEIPHGAKFTTVITLNGPVTETIEFPEDEITDLLNQYGCNRCAEQKKK